MVRVLAVAFAVALLVASIVAADAFPILGNRHVPSGFGWRLVSEVDDDPYMAFQVRAATDRTGFDELWKELGWDERRRSDLTGVPPWLAVNFEREVVVLFGVGINSCTASVNLDDIVIDRSNRLVHSVTSQRTNCGYLDLSGAVVFVVALDRGVLPLSPFTVQLHAEPTCRSCQEHDDRLIL